MRFEFHRCHSCAYVSNEASIEFVLECVHPMLLRNSSDKWTFIGDIIQQ